MGQDRYAEHETSASAARGCLQAVSVSEPIWDFLNSANRSGAIAATFERAWVVRFEEGTLFGVVVPEVGDGPLNVVAQAVPSEFATLLPGQQVAIANGIMELDEFCVTLKGASIWNPVPDWQWLRERQRAMTARLHSLFPLAEAAAPVGSLIQLLSTPAPSPPSVAEVGERSLAKAGQAALSLRAAVKGVDTAKISVAAAQLAGLGLGLTPAGDDFLMGVMIWAWLACPNPNRLCQSLLENTAKRTSQLSAAFLAAAARGECSAAWHELLNAVGEGDDGRIESAVYDVVAHGHTSGADTLAGLLWMVG